MSIFLKILVVVVLVLVVDIGRYFFIPDVDALVKTNPIPTAFMEYRQEQWRVEGRDIKLQQRWVPMSKISPNIAKAVLIGEDDGFYAHDGFDVGYGERHRAQYGLR
jgi:monofunctional biosynthetic peptidoglycan transglycosylase